MLRAGGLTSLYIRSINPLSRERQFKAGRPAARQTRDRRDVSRKKGAAVVTGAQNLPTSKTDRDERKTRVASAFRLSRGWLFLFFRKVLLIITGKFTWDTRLGSNQEVKGRKKRKNRERETVRSGGEKIGRDKCDARFLPSRGTVGD